MEAAAIWGLMSRTNCVAEAVYYFTMSQTAAAHIAVMATDSAIEVAMSLTHSRIDTVQFRPAPLPHRSID
jgi:hypothetical protein